MRNPIRVASIIGALIFAFSAAAASADEHRAFRAEGLEFVMGDWISGMKQGDVIWGDKNDDKHAATTVPLDAKINHILAWFNGGHLVMIEIDGVRICGREKPAPGATSKELWLEQGEQIDFAVGMFHGSPAIFDISVR